MEQSAHFICLGHVVHCYNILAVLICFIFVHIKGHMFIWDYLIFPFYLFSVSVSMNILMLIWQFGELGCNQVNCRAKRNY